MRYPYERFLRFLVSRKADVNAKLERYGLPPVGDLWVARARSSIRAEGPHGIVSYIDSPDDQLIAQAGVLEWADAEGFRCLWEYQPEFGALESIDLRSAFRVFVNPHARAACGMLFLSNADVDEIKDLLQERFELEISPSSLQLYRTLFWDTSLLEREEWPSFIGKLLTKDEQHFLAVGLSSPTIDHIRDVLDAGPLVDHDDIIEDLVALAYRQFKRAMGSPHPESQGALRWHEATLRAWTASKTAARERAKEEHVPTSGDFEGLFSVQVTKSKHISLTELQGTVSEHKEAKQSEGGS